MFDMRKMQERVIYEAVKREHNEKIAEQVVYGEKDIIEDDAKWVNEVMNRLDKSFTPEKVKNIRMGCQCGYGMEEKVTLVKELMAEASSMEMFANSQKARNAGLSYKEGTLYLQFHFCPCPMLKDIDKLESKTWCQCTIGYSKVLFERAFECKVEVKLCKSIKCGDDICLMKIIPQHDLW